MSAVITWTDPDTYVLSWVEFDATLAENHGAAAIITEHPVEIGVDITDHVRPKRASLTIEAMISNTPVGPVNFGVSQLGDIGFMNIPTPFVLNGKTTRQITTARVTGGVLPGRLGRIVDALGIPTRVNGLPRPSTPVIATRGVFVEEPNVWGGTSLQSPFRVDRVRAVFDALFALVAKGTEVFVDTGLRHYESMLIEEVTAPVVAADAITFTIRLVELRKVATGLAVVRRSVSPAEKRAEPPAPPVVAPTGWDVPPDAGSDLQDIGVQAAQSFEPPL